jgi:hypothetical protein
MFCVVKLTLAGMVPLLLQSQLLKVSRKTFSNGLVFKRLHVYDTLRSQLTLVGMVPLLLQSKLLKVS